MIYGTGHTTDLSIQIEIFNDFPTLAHAFVILFGLMYALDPSSPKGLDNTFDFTQKDWMGLEDGKLRARVLGLKNLLLSVEFPQCLNKAYKGTLLFDISFKL
uniref:Uncharacterized protein n=1 Tax=Sinocyclocheilus grahami TaxID=75366 RepID=A0A672KFR6_SINGR